MRFSNPRASHYIPRQRGFTLVEVLVSLVVLSIGLLGIGKLVLYSSRANNSAYLRSQATSLAYAILDNMRANRQTAISQRYDTALRTAAANPGFSCDGLGALCAPDNLALFDVYRWKTRVAAALPSGAGAVTTNVGAAQTTAVVTVEWDDAVAQATFRASPEGIAAPLGITLETVL